MCNLFRRLTLSLLVGISALVFTAISINTAFAIEPVEVAKLMASDGAADDYFGNAVALDGDTAVIGAYGDDEGAGSAYVFRWDGATWVEHKLTASDGAADDYFGFYSVALDGDTAVIGATGDDDLGDRSGSAYVFRWDGATWIEHKLTARDGAAYDSFGVSVAVDGNTAVIGAAGDDDLGDDSGSAYVFVPSDVIFSSSFEGP